MLEGVYTNIMAGFNDITAKLVELGPTMLFLFAGFVIAFFGIKLIQYLVKKFFKKVDFNPDVELLIVNFTGWILWFLVLTWFVGTLGLEGVFESVLALGALGGLAVALAVKDTLADVVSGVMILQDRHFDLGDKIKTQGKEGKIIEVSLRKTRLLQKDGAIAVIPNAKIDGQGWEFLERNGQKAEDFAKKKEFHDYVERETKRLKKIKKLVKK